MACFTFVPEDEQSGFKTLLTSHVGAHFCFRIIIKCYPRSLGRLQKSQEKKKTVSFPGRWWLEDVMARCVEPRQQVALCTPSDLPMFFSKNSVNSVSWDQISEVLVPMKWWQINMCIYRYEVENYFPLHPGSAGRHLGLMANRDVLHGEGVRVRAHPPPSSLTAQHEASQSPLQPGSLVSVGISGLGGSTGTESKGQAEGEKQRRIHVLFYLLLLDEFLRQRATWAKVSPRQEHTGPTEDPKAMRWLSRRVQKWAFWRQPSNVSRCFGFYAFLG